MAWLSVLSKIADLICTAQLKIVMSVRWICAYPLSYRNIEELMEERGALVIKAQVSFNENIR